MNALTGNPPLLAKNLDLDAALLSRYEQPGPRYTSYPTAAEFDEQFGESEYRAQARYSNENPIPWPLSLYVHIPFCDTVCYYCACSKIVTKNRARAGPYLERLHREIALLGASFDTDRPVDQLHWGGGTPTFLSHEQMRGLMFATAEHFNLHADDGGEYSIEVDPRSVNELTIALLRRLGFNRISLGVQDFDPRVQKAVNRIQSEEQTLLVMQAARRHQFRSINIDLIYGLPFQTVASFARTLTKVIAVDPDRLSVFNYAHLQQLFKTQQQINVADLPSSSEKLDIIQQTITRLTEAGYVHIGMDHFTKPDDDLAAAQRDGTLQRNFQGYSTHADCDLVGLGITAISHVGDCYAQNVRTLEDYYKYIDAGRLPVYRGIELSQDDWLRREVIMQLICHFELDIETVERRYDISFRTYFDREQADLQTMQDDGLLVQDGNTIRVSPRGKLLIRNICMVFDRHLREKAPGQLSSWVI